MALTLSDDVDTVDISEAEVTKRREPRIAVLSAPNRRADIIQGFGSEGFKLTIEGVWVVADSSRPDTRPILDRWRRDNTLVKYVDGNYKAWFTIRSFSTRLVPGAPGNEIAAWYAMELSEAIRIQTSSATGGPEDNPIITQGVSEELPTEGTFTTWSQNWTVQDTAEIWLTALIDDTTSNLKVSFFSNDTIKVRTLVDGTVIVTDASIVLEPSTQARRAYSRAGSIQGVYQVVPDSVNLQRFKVYKNGVLLFTSSALGFNVVDIVVSSSGKYIAVIADTTNFDRLFVFQGS